MIGAAEIHVNSSETIEWRKYKHLLYGTGYVPDSDGNRQPALFIKSERGGTKKGGVFMVALSTAHEYYEFTKHRGGDGRVKWHATGRLSLQGRAMMERIADRIGITPDRSNCRLLADLFEERVKDVLAMREYDMVRGDHERQGTPYGDITLSVEGEQVGGLILRTGQD